MELSLTMIRKAVVACPSLQRRRPDIQKSPQPISIRNLPPQTKTQLSKAVLDVGSQQEKLVR
jgi:hypothetical protein